jgi:uncharacterized phage protein (TIGR01671 family)
MYLAEFLVGRNSMDNRTIKFRVWDTDGNGKMFNWDDCRDTQLLNDAFDGKHAVAMQFTGLKDKNDQDIYEGDIIQQHHHEYPKLMNLETKNYEVKYQTMVETHGSYSAGFYADVFSIHKDCEIIGNIFENSELLKQNT